MCVSLFLRLYLLCDNGVYHGHDGDVHNVADGTFDVGEVDRLVQAHLPIISASLMACISL